MNQPMMQNIGLSDKCLLFFSLEIGNAAALNLTSIDDFLSLKPRDD